MMNRSGLSMNGTLDELPIFLSVAQESMPEPAIQFQTDTTTAVVPLIRHMQKSPLLLGCPIQPALVVTVELALDRVWMQWLSDLSKIEDKFNLTHSPQVRERGVGMTWAINAPARVQYHLPRKTLDEYTDAQGLPRLPKDVEPRVPSGSTFSGLTQLILPSLLSPELFSSMFMDHFVMLFCAHVVHLHAVDHAQPIEHRGGLSTWQKRRAAEILGKNIHCNVTLSHVAKECGLSVSHFARSFKTTFGSPVHRWIIRQRVQRAKELLLQSEQSLLDIAFQAGFSDQAAFTRTFAKLTGMSPGRWRKYFRVS